MSVRVSLLFVLLLLLSMASLAHATTWRFTDKDGTVWLTNKKLTQNGNVKYVAVDRLAKSRAAVSCVPAGNAEMDRRLRRLNPLIKAYADHYGVDDGLVHAIISVESCYDVNAVSRVGAQGLMQLMPKTAESLGVSDAFDPDQNLRAGIEYFSRLSKRFNYNYQHALAAYNAGPTTVEKYAGIPPYKETRNYVAKVLNIYRENLTSPDGFSATPLLPAKHRAIKHQ